MHKGSLVVLQPQETFNSFKQTCLKALRLSAENHMSLEDITIYVICSGQDLMDALEVKEITGLRDGEKIIVCINEPLRRALRVEGEERDIMPTLVSGSSVELSSRPVSTQPGDDRSKSNAKPKPTALPAVSSTPTELSKPATPTSSSGSDAEMYTWTKQFSLGLHHMLLRQELLSALPAAPTPLNGTGNVKLSTAGPEQGLSVSSANEPSKVEGELLLDSKTAR